MFKKVILLLCVLCLMAWAGKPKAKSAAPAPKAAVEDEFDDSDFESADSEGSSQASVAGDDDEDFEEAEDPSLTGAQKADLDARKKFEEEQRLDEYANSLRRRNWLKDRLIFQIGMGSRYPFMGETGMGMGFGLGAEYITRWGLGVYASGGLLPKGDDNDFEGIELEGGYGYKVGINYYLFPKNPLHLGVSASYGTVYYDHNVEPKDGVRPLITVNGYQFDVLISYMTNEWYYLQFSVGMYYSPELGKETPEENPSLRYQSEGSSKIISSVVNPDGMSKTGIVFGIAIGYALPEFFPDDTEKRRRQREKERNRSR
ncbi:MAG: hypothetical protein IKP90_03010 [Fibrobacter sp.]|jgi:hypothetical protein|nr:hypothetical protein [Fibrobacter sp.]